MLWKADFINPHSIMSECYMAVSDGPGASRAATQARDVFCSMERGFKAADIFWQFNLENQPRNQNKGLIKVKSSDFKTATSIIMPKLILL